MNKYVFNILFNLLGEVKAFKKYENLDKIKSVLNNEIESAKCKAVIVNESTKADAFFGLVVFPNVKLGDNEDSKVRISDYVIEIQKKLVDLLTPEELASMILHDISHNILSTTVIERFKTAIYKACHMTNTPVVEIIHNIETKMYNIAILDISNRTYKDAVVPDTDMYEPDRLLVDMGICKYWNSALEKLHTIDQDNLSNPDHQEIMDSHIGLKVIKMVREKVKGITLTYDQMISYVKAMYDTAIFTYYPAIDAQVSTEIYGMDASGVEDMKPLELQFLTEGAIEKIRKNKGTCPAMILESIFDNPSKISYSALQKELDVINFKIDSISSNFERLSVLDRIYDNIFSLEKYIQKNPTNTLAPQYLKKFKDLIESLREAKPSKKRYDVFVEYPSGWKG